ncbi:MAG: serine hydrolase domain-containing protein [Bacteroidales bacterium]|nr:serine hydrolase domain-containing protein [Bacteroidales bacterium]
MRIIKMLFFFSFILLTISCRQGEKPVSPEGVGISSDTLDMASERMQSYIDQDKLAGIAVRTIKDGFVAHDARFGFADIENEIPIEEETIYRIFSMSKPVTTVALMTLYEDGNFELDDKVADYIPEFAETKVYTPGEEGFTLEGQENEMTIRHLLTHTSGLTYGWEPGSYVDSLYNASGVVNWDAPLADKVKQLASLPLKYQPGTRWEYGLSIDVAGYLVEVLSGTTLDKYLANEVFGPLGMDDTGFYVPEDKHSRLSKLYTRDRNGKLVKLSGTAGVTDAEADFNDIFKQPAIHFSGGGGLVSTVDDYARFARMLLNGGELDGTRILEQATVDLIMSDQLPGEVAYNKAYGYGLGGQVDINTGSYSWGGAASTNFVVDPSQTMIILAFTQFMPSDYSYFGEYVEIVRKAIIKE